MSVATQETAQITLVPDSTTPTTLALLIAGCETAREFKVQVSEERAVTWHTLGVTGRAFKIDGLTPGSTYCVRVKVVSAEEWLNEYCAPCRFTLPTATDVTPLMRQPAAKSTLVKQYKQWQKDLASLPGKRLTLIVQGNRSEYFIRALQNTVPKYVCTHCSIVALFVDWN